MELEVRGPVAFREFALEYVCKVSENHQHNYDHAIVIVSGRVSLSITGVEGTREHGPGDVIAVPANQFHVLKALTVDVRYLCVFSHRDFSGIVTQEYQGNDAAYH